MGGVTEDGRDEGGEWEYDRSVPRSETSPVMVGEQEEEGQGLWEAGRVLRDWEGKGSRELDTLVYRPSFSCNLFRSALVWSSFKAVSPRDVHFDWVCSQSHQCLHASFIPLLSCNVQ